MKMYNKILFLEIYQKNKVWNPIMTRHPSTTQIFRAIILSLL
jgi:hypothetical protein